MEEEMKRLTFSRAKINKEIKKFELPLPKGFYGMINAHCGWSQAAKPKNIGQMSELACDFIEQNPKADHEDWIEYYNSNFPGIFDECFDMFRKYVCKCWPEYFSCTEEELLLDDKFNLNLYNYFYNLVFIKTFYGFYYQEFIFTELSKIENKVYKKSSVKEDAAHIDGYLGTMKCSIKPESWRIHSNMSPIKISDDIKMIYYEKLEGNRGITVEYDFEA